MSSESLKLTTYFGEHDRASGRFLADALLDVCERHRLRVSVLLRGTEGFGARHRLQTERLLTLSEDLPVVGVAVDTRERIEAALQDVVEIFGHGLITLERARLGPDGAPPPAAAKLTVYVGRRGRPSVAQVVAAMRSSGLAGATALLGVDGTVGGERRRARFFDRNAGVPVMVIGVGPGEAVAAAAAALGDALMTVERVTVCKQDGRVLAPPPQAPAVDEHGLGIWQKLMVYHPRYVPLIRRLREANAAGATALRGVWGYAGAEEPRGDRFWSLRRHVPVVTVVVDEPDRIARWFQIADEVTGDEGLITCELVPALRASGPGFTTGGLRPARTH